MLILWNLNIMSPGIIMNYALLPVRVVIVGQAKYTRTLKSHVVCVSLDLPKFETYVCSLSLTFFNPRGQSYSNNDSREWLK